MTNQRHVMTGVPGRGGLRHEVLIRTVATNRIGGREEQHHANMANPGCTSANYRMEAAPADLPERISPNTSGVAVVSAVRVSALRLSGSAHAGVAGESAQARLATRFGDRLDAPRQTR